MNNTGRAFDFSPWTFINVSVKIDIKLNRLAGSSAR